MSQAIFLSASQLAQAIRSRELSAVEVLGAHLDHIARHNPALNAIVTLDEERARQRAKEADAALARGEIWGPLHGVPVTIKDVFETAGLRTTSSFRHLANYIPRRDATVVARLRAAGAIVLGKTNMPELATGFQSDSPLFGRTNNPWDLNRTPGGSSGGSAAAVAAGLSPLCLASDAGGSIRIPAHFCGVFGLKATNQMVSTAGHIPPMPGWGRGLFRFLNSVGALARSVEDLRLCLSIIVGPDERQGEVSPVSLATPPERPLRGRRFAWTDGLGDVPVTKETRAALEELAGKLTQLGCVVERRDPPEFDFAQALLTKAEIMTVAVLSIAPPSLRPRFLFRALSKVLFKQNPLDRGYLVGMGADLRQYGAALSRRDALTSALERFLTNWDAWLCPVVPVPAFPHKKIKGSIDALRAFIEVDDEKIPYSMGTSAYTAVFNLTGNPVVVLPLARSKEGLPIGVQVVGRRWGDMELLAVAEQLAKVTGPFQRPSGY